VVTVRDNHSRAATPDIFFFFFFFAAVCFSTS
jgi:hypothetical protein